MTTPEGQAVTDAFEQQSAYKGNDTLHSPLLSALSSVFSRSTPAWIKVTTLALLLLGLLLTALSFFVTRESALQRDQLDFDRRVDAAVDEVAVTLHTHAMLVAGLQGLFRANPDVSRIEFHRFVQSMQLGDRNSNVLAQTWNPVVPKSWISTFEARVQADDSLHKGGYPNFQVRPQPEHANSFVVTYAEPMTGNEKALGFDIGSNPARRAAAEEARDTGKLVATAPITLINDGSNVKGYLMMLPVYGSQFPQNLQERQHDFLGIVVAVFRVGNLIEESSDFGAVQVWDITDSPTQSDEQLVHVSGKPGNGLYAERRVAVGGRTWGLRFDHFSLKHTPHSKIFEMTIAFMGSLATLLATTLFALLATSRQRALANATILTQDLREANEELNRSNADLSQFAHIASHDLQTPVRNVISAVDLLEDHLGESADEETHELLGYLQSSATRMRKLVLELLDYAKLGRDAIHLSTIELDDVLQVAVEATLIQCQESETQLSVKKLPVIIGDPDQLERVFVNLITNAIKYAHPDRKPVVDIFCRSQSHPDNNEANAEIVVSDNGQGIEAQYHSLVFQPFKRLHRHDDIPGTGLGLGICKQIIERHGGSIEIESSSNKGTTFLICLPQSNQEPDLG